MTDWMRTQEERMEAFQEGRADECASWQHSLAVLLPPEFDCTPDGVASYIRQLQAPTKVRGGADLTKVENPPKNPLSSAPEDAHVGPLRRSKHPLRGDRHE